MDAVLRIPRGVPDLVEKPSGTERWPQLSFARQAPILEFFQHRAVLPAADAREHEIVEPGTRQFEFRKQGYRHIGGVVWGAVLACQLDDSTGGDSHIEDNVVGRGNQSCLSDGSSWPCDIG